MAPLMPAPPRIKRRKVAGAHASLRLPKPPDLFELTQSDDALQAPQPEQLLIKKIQSHEHQAVNFPQLATDKQQSMLSAMELALSSWGTANRQCSESKRLSHETELQLMLQQRAITVRCKHAIQSEENRSLLQSYKFEKLFEKDAMMRSLRLKRRGGEDRLEESDRLLAQLRALLRERYFGDGLRNEEDGRRTRGAKRERPCILGYASPFVRRFDLLTCVLVLYDCFMVPFKNSFGSQIFDEQTNLIINIVEVLIKAVFAADVVICFRKAYVHEKG